MRRCELEISLAFAEVAFTEQTSKNPTADEGNEEDDGHDDPLVVGLYPVGEVSLCLKSNAEKLKERASVVDVQ